MSQTFLSRKKICNYFRTTTTKPTLRTLVLPSGSNLTIMSKITKLPTISENSMSSPELSTIFSPRSKFMSSPELYNIFSPRKDLSQHQEVHLHITNSTNTSNTTNLTMLPITEEPENYDRDWGWFVEV